MFILKMFYKMFELGILFILLGSAYYYGYSRGKSDVSLLPDIHINEQVINETIDSIGNTIDNVKGKFE
jgi:hypothetical protein